MQTIEGTSLGIAPATRPQYSEALMRHRRPNVIDLFCFNRKYLIYNLVLRNLKMRYRKSLLGLFWTILIPAVNAVVFYFVFQFVMKVQVPNYLLYVLSGLIPWGFLANAMTTSMESLLINYSILNKVPVPPFAFTYAEVLTNLINFAAALPVLIVIALLTQGGLSWGILLYPLLAMILFLMAYGIGLIIAFGNVFYRDVRHVMGIIIQIWFYLTPILYTHEMVPEKFKYIIYLNPVGHMFEGFHGLIMGAAPKAEWFYIPLVWAIAILLLAHSGIRRWNARIVESV